MSNNTTNTTTTTNVEDSNEATTKTNSKKSSEENLKSKTPRKNKKGYPKFGLRILKLAYIRKNVRPKYKDNGLPWGITKKNFVKFNTMDPAPYLSKSQMFVKNQLHKLNHIDHATRIIKRFEKKNSSLNKKELLIAEAFRQIYTDETNLNKKIIVPTSPVARIHHASIQFVAALLERCIPKITTFKTTSPKEVAQKVLQVDVLKAAFMELRNSPWYQGPKSGSLHEQAILQVFSFVEYLKEKKQSLKKEEYEKLKTEKEGKIREILDKQMNHTRADFYSEDGCKNLFVRYGIGKASRFVRLVLEVIIRSHMGEIVTKCYFLMSGYRKTKTLSMKIVDCVLSSYFYTTLLY